MKMLILNNWVKVGRLHGYEKKDKKKSGKD